MHLQLERYRDLADSRFALAIAAQGDKQTSAATHEYFLEGDEGEGGGGALATLVRKEGGYRCRNVAAAKGIDENVARSFAG